MFKHDIILELCKNKTVLHIGATDSPYHLKRAKRGCLLHQRLQTVCRDIVGIDVDKKAIYELKKYFSINNIYYGDIVAGVYDVDLYELDFDVIVFPMLLNILVVRPRH